MIQTGSSSPWISDSWNQKVKCEFLAQRPERVSFVIQKQRNEAATPDQGYIYKFFKMGKWMSYKVDKMLPTSIAAIAADNEHWVPYCKKAYAK